MLTVRLTDSEKRALDEARGRMALSKYVRRVIRHSIGESDED